MTLAAVEQCPLAGHPLAEAIEAQLPRDVWDLRVFGYPNLKEGRWARFKGRADRASRGATEVSQPWLLGIAKEFVLRGALRRISTSYLDDVVLSIALLSATLRERADCGDQAQHLDRRDVTVHLIRLGQMRQAGLPTLKGQQRAVRYLSRALEDSRAWASPSQARSPTAWRTASSCCAATCQPDAGVVSTSRAVHCHTKSSGSSSNLPPWPAFRRSRDAGL